jgi:HlyD family secretion protein
MKTWKKVIIGVAVAVVLAGMLGFTIVQSRRNVVSVQTGKARHQDLTSVISASGEIKPKNYANIGANVMGRIVKLYVKEGDRVKQGELLAQLDNVQWAADVAANQAAFEGAHTDAEAAQANLKTMQANLARAKADVDRARLDYERAQGLFKEALIARQDFDSKKAVWESAEATVAQCQAAIVQAKAQQESSVRRIAQSKANLRHAADLLSKTEYRAPFDATVTNLPVREGETVVTGIQNSLGSTLMTLADMSVITAEVKVDETDIVNLRLGQPAEVTIDALPKQTFHGIVTEIGENAMLRSTGVATSQSTGGTQEAKDFKVVVTVQDPPANLRPGLSCTAKITTAARKNVLAIPIQALTVRQRKDLEVAKAGARKAETSALA